MDAYQPANHSSQREIIYKWFSSSTESNSNICRWLLQLSLPKGMCLPSERDCTNSPYMWDDRKKCLVTKEYTRAKEHTVYAQAVHFGITRSDQMNQRPRTAFEQRNLIWTSIAVEMSWFGLLCCLRDRAACSHWFHSEFSLISKTSWSSWTICLKFEVKLEVDLSTA